MTLPLVDLKEAYEEICQHKKIMNSRKLNYEASKTLSEHRVGKHIRENTKLSFFTSFWIGNRNIDIFFPQLLEHGLAIEIDGAVHSQETKIKKDSHKFEQLEVLGIKGTVIKNEDLLEPTVKALIRELKTLKRLDTRGRKRVIRNIYIFTIIQNFKQVELSKYFKPEGIQVLKDIKEQLKISHLYQL